MEEITKIESIDQYDQLFGLETLHPLVNVIDFSKATKTVDYYINGKTNCSLFSKHFAQDFVLLTQNKMYILLFPIICFSDFVLSLLLLS